MTLINDLKALYDALRAEKRARWNRQVPFGELITDRTENAIAYGFGEGTTCYESVFIFGDVTVGKNCWIGPNVILDGRGGLVIGDYCDISASVHIYTHDTVKRATSFGNAEEELSPVSIGSGVYIGPQSVISRGVTIGDQVVIGAKSYVDCDIPSRQRAWGIPARLQPPKAVS